MTSPSEKDKTTIQQPMAELKQGMDMLNERQKHIRIADQSEHHWETVVAYKGSDVADDEEDAKRIEKAAEQLASRKKKKAVFQRAKRLPPSPAQLPPGPSMVPIANGTPRMPQFNPVRPIGPCYNCYQLGHLKANCPSLNRSMYPFCLHNSGIMGAVNVGCGGEGLSNIGKKDIQAQTSLSMSKMLLITNPAAESATYPQNKVSAEYGNT